VAISARRSRTRGGGGSWLVVADRVGGVQLDQQLAQLGELLWSELSFELGFDLSDGLADGLRGGVAAIGQVDPLGSPVGRVVLAVR
jgi:hypothetical protein